ncbi:unnamed protein product [Amoebophrya sp. A25]|nr:unnamed protein product [Amoebophrya sp. A25]|eukprot:GSA25T00014253001.1
MPTAIDSNSSSKVFEDQPDRIDLKLPSPIKERRRDLEDTMTAGTDSTEAFPLLNRESVTISRKTSTITEPTRMLSGSSFSSGSSRDVGVADVHAGNSLMKQEGGETSTSRNVMGLQNGDQGQHPHADTLMRSWMEASSSTAAIMSDANIQDRASDSNKATHPQHIKHEHLLRQHASVEESQQHGHAVQYSDSRADDVAAATPVGSFNGLSLTCYEETRTEPTDHDDSYYTGHPHDAQGTEDLLPDTAEIARGMTAGDVIQHAAIYGGHYSSTLYEQFAAHHSGAPTALAGISRGLTLQGTRRQALQATDPHDIAAQYHQQGKQGISGPRVYNRKGKNATATTTGPPPPPGLEMTAATSNQVAAPQRFQGFYDQAVAAPAAYQGGASAKIGEKQGGAYTKGHGKFGKQNGKEAASMYPAVSTSSNVYAQRRCGSNKQGAQPFFGQHSSDAMANFVSTAYGYGYSGGKGSHYAGKGPAVPSSGFPHDFTASTSMPPAAPSPMLEKGAWFAMRGSKGVMQHFNNYNSTPAATIRVGHFPFAPYAASNLQHHGDQFAASMYNNHPHDNAAQHLHPLQQDTATQLQHVAAHRASTDGNGTQTPPGSSAASSTDNAGGKTVHAQLVEDALAHVARINRENQLRSNARSRLVNAGKVVDDQQSEEGKLQHFFKNNPVCGNPICRQLLPFHGSGIWRVFCRGCINFMVTQCCKEEVICKAEDFEKWDSSLPLMWEGVYEELRTLLPDLETPRATIPQALGNATRTDSETLKICYSAWPFLFGLERRENSGATNVPDSDRHCRGVVSYSGKYLVKVQATECTNERYESLHHPATRRNNRQTGAASRSASSSTSDPAPSGTEFAHHAPMDLPEVVLLKYAAAANLKSSDTVCMTLKRNELEDPLVPYMAKLQHERNHRA